MAEGGNRGAEFLEMSTHWGYFSKHDCELWEAQVCEQCTVNVLMPIIKFQRYEYQIISGEKKYLIPKEGEHCPNKKCENINVEKATGEHGDYLKCPNCNRGYPL